MDSVPQDGHTPQGGQGPRKVDYVYTRWTVPTQGGLCLVSTRWTVSAQGGLCLHKVDYVYTRLNVQNVQNIKTKQSKGPCLHKVDVSLQGGNRQEESQGLGEAGEGQEDRREEGEEGEAAAQGQEDWHRGGGPPVPATQAVKR